MEFMTEESDSIFQSDCIYPSVEDIKQYFPEDVWNTIAEYEQNSYRNILHNYNMMTSLGLNPKKPPFMVMYQRKASKRKVEDPVFSCDKCNETYTSPLNLEVHEKRCRGSRPVKTVEPSLVPTDVQQLAVMVDGRKTYYCNVCDYKTASSVDIRRHMMIHSGDKRHICDVCDKEFTRAGNLVAHKRIHTGDRPYKCDQCSYAATRSGALSVHMKRHSGEKVYACTECDYKTADSSNMKHHSRRHTGDRPHCCTLCSYRAAHSSDLNRHMRTHTGDKPYACPHCQYRASQNSCLNRHVARLHPDLK